MSAFDLLDRLREKPESYRFRVAIIVAFVATLVIASVWVLTLDFGGGTGRAVSVPAEDGAGGASPFETIWESFSGVFKESSQQFDELQDVFTSPPGNSTNSAETL